MLCSRLKRQMGIAGAGPHPAEMASKSGDGSAGARTGARASVGAAHRTGLACLGDLLHGRRRLVVSRGPVGLAAVAAWAALWPSEETDRHARGDARRPTYRRRRQAWRMVVDAVPEPAVVLDSTGYIVHANRMAEDLFGTRRRGGHVASMSRDPELLEAVDEALAAGETAASGAARARARRAATAGDGRAARAPRSQCGTAPRC